MDFLNKLTKLVDKLANNANQLTPVLLSVAMIISLTIILLALWKL